MSLWKVKAKASAWHCAASLLVFSVITFILIKILYPSFYFNMSGGFQGLKLMFFIDVVLGPLITLVVYNPSKPRREILSDFAIIVAIQIAALVYGAFTVYKESPSYAVVYQYGTGVTNLRRDYDDGDKTDASQFTKIGGIPTGFYLINEDGSEQIIDIAKAPSELLQKMNDGARGYLKPDEKAEIDAIEKQQPIWVYALMGKYTGAYVVVDKQFNFVKLVGETEL